MNNEGSGFAQLYRSLYPFIIILDYNTKPKTEL